MEAELQDALASRTKSNWETRGESVGEIWDVWDVGLQHSYIWNNGSNHSRTHD